LHKWKRTFTFNSFLTGTGIVQRDLSGAKTRVI
jgi:hypothetical protein